MTPDVINIIWSVVVPAVITAVVSIWLGRAQGRSVKVDIERKYKEMLAEEIEERRKLMDRFDEIEEKYKKLHRAFERSIRFIRVNLPNVDIPDFFQDTGEVKNL